MFGFVNDFEHADAVVFGVCVDDVGDPFEEFVGAFVLVGDVEAGCWRFLDGGF